MRLKIYGENYHALPPQGEFDDGGARLFSDTIQSLRASYIQKYRNDEELSHGQRIFMNQLVVLILGDHAVLQENLQQSLISGLNGNRAERGKNRGNGNKLGLSNEWFHAGPTSIQEDPRY